MQIMEGQPKRVRRERLIPYTEPKGQVWQVENDAGGPTSVYSGSVQGISRIVRIAHNYMRGLSPDHGLEKLAPLTPEDPTPAPE